MKKYLAYASILGAIEILILLYLTMWRKIFWDYVASRDLHNFIHYLIIFAIVALILCIVNASDGYAISLASIKWREKLTGKAVTLTKYKNIEIDNVSQRIQEDCKEYPALALSVGFGTVKAFLYILVFSASLIYNFSLWWLLVISTYSIVSTFIAKKIGFPLISLNYQSQRAEATYRNNITDVNFKDCIVIMFGMASKLKHLQYFQSLYGQVGIIIPLIIIAPAYFAYKISFGQLMQANSTMGTISDNLSFGINNFDNINKLISCRRRLKEMGVL